jgi:hypothetical protein
MDSLIYKSPVSKRLAAFKKLEQYILQQRKRKIAIYTNDTQMIKLLKNAYPEIIVIDIRTGKIGEQ